MSKPRTEYSPLNPFRVVDDCLQFGGMPLTQLAQQIGKTPFYAYDRQLIAERIATLRKQLHSSIRLHYAVKANPMPSLLQFIGSLVDGFDVASAGEMRLALTTGVPAGAISIAGPGKTTDELSQALDAGIVISMESENEMKTIARLAGNKGVRPRVVVRVNPDFELKTSGMKMAGGAKPFGVDAERVPALLARLKELDMDFQGFHIFSGSQNLSAQAIIDSQKKTFELVFRLAEYAPAPVRLLNIGGGFGIPYFPGDKPLELTLIGEHMKQQAPQVKHILPDAEIVLELGRYLVGEAGIYVCRIVDRKISRGQIYLVTNGGLHHHLAATGNFGQVIRRNFPVVVGNKVYGKKREVATVVGPLCTPLDLLADKIELTEANIGDLIVVLQSGAYGLTASPTAFLSHPPPAEILV